MKNLQELLKEITELTFKIEKKYPELYQFLDENPQTIPSKYHPEINKKELQDYLESLKQLLSHHLETHTIK
ncbi:hypothetical protein [Lutibacter flavus]|uniref:Uncharacterized protein n=1 Tax=Lutibacter flavus TaxID=691689 RepID=A0A238XLH0_9FLAO|nr:hypothetical protein [Lutibacter flavus]SNR59431.1 hypothetical protein SAMN04488111_1905 [Lutibacter flavus]